MRKTREKIERLPEVIQRTGRSRSSIFGDIKKGTFPKPIKIGERSIGWPSSVIDNWIDQQIKAAA